MGVAFMRAQRVQLARAAPLPLARQPSRRRPGATSFPPSLLHRPSLRGRGHGRGQGRDRKADAARRRAPQPRPRAPHPRPLQAEYDDFFKLTFKEFLDPLAVAHFRVEGSLEFAAMLFLPSMPPFEQRDWMAASRNIRLFVK